MPITRPVNLQVPFAASGTKNTIPVASQIGIVAGAASFTDGFPPLTMTPIAAGGVPPAGADMNGALNILSQHTTFLNAGGLYRFDAALATAIGGYPVGFVLQDDAGLSSYVNILAANTTNFNSTPASIGVSWMPWAGTAVNTAMLTKSIAGNTDVTLSPTAEAIYPIINLTGALTGNINVIVPASSRQWIIANNTSGAFAITIKTAAGTGVIIPQGPAMVLYCDGTNVQTASTPVPSTTAITTAGGTTTLTAAQAAGTSFEISGVLTSNAIIVVPNSMGLKSFENLTSGAFTVTIQTASGTGFVIEQGAKITAYANGVNAESLAGLGYGQTWQTVTRVPATTYYNTTGKPIFINFELASSIGGSVPQLTINSIVTSGTYQATATQGTSMSGIVPPGGSYSATMTLGTPSVAVWNELR